MTTESRRLAWIIINNFRAVMFSPDLRDDDFDFIRDAVLTTIEREKAFRARFRAK